MSEHIFYTTILNSMMNDNFPLNPKMTIDLLQIIFIGSLQNGEQWAFDLLPKVNDLLLSFGISKL